MAKSGEQVNKLLDDATPPDPPYEGGEYAGAIEDEFGRRNLVSKWAIQDEFGVRIDVASPVAGTDSKRIGLPGCEVSKKDELSKRRESRGI
jgi:hypothetical protein